MNFFKKVMTFFSTIWNAILWRKSDKKAKPTSKASKEEYQAEVESNPVSEAERLFVDVPLHSPEASEATEQEILISDEKTAGFTPIVAHNIEYRTVAESEIKKHSESSFQLFGFEEETSRSLSFFSEPVRDDDPETDLPLPENEMCELKAIEDILSDGTGSAEPETVQPLKFEEDSNSNPFLEPTQDGKELETAVRTSEDRSCEISAKNKATIPEVSEVNEVNQLDNFDLPVSEELPTPPSDPISSAYLNDREGIPKLISGEESASRAFLHSDSAESPSAEDGSLLGIQRSVENITSSSTDHSTIIPTNNINPDLIYFAIGDEMHLFDHSGVTEMFITEEKSEKKETAQEFENAQPAGADLTSMTENFTMIGTAENETAQNEQSMASSSTLVLPIGVSVSATQGSPDTNEHVTESSSKYSTNYMVKSDSLVNFLPEDGSHLHVSDVVDPTDLLLESAQKPMSHDEAKEISVDNSTATLKEGGLEEMMCTPRGILKLSGDHNCDSSYEKCGIVDEPKQSHDVKAAVDDFLIDAFVAEEPLLLTSHLEGSILEETVRCDTTRESQILQDILGSVETGLDDSECVEDSDKTTNSECQTLLDTIGCCRSAIRDIPDFPEMPSRCRNNSKQGSPKLEHEENEENRKSPCKLSPLTRFRLDDDPDPAGYLKRNAPVVPGLLTVRHGEIRASSGLSTSFLSENEHDSSNHAVEEGSTNRFMANFQRSELLEGLDWRVTIPLPELEAVNEIHEPVLGSHINQCDPDGENVNDSHPFIDCSSCLFRIPEEIRNDTGFNPCVGAAPTRRSSSTNNANLQAVRFDDGHDAYESKYTKLNAMAPSFVGTAPLINACIPDEYDNTRIAKLPDGYNQSPVPQHLGTFWGAHPGTGHYGDQQQATVGYPVSYNEDYYEGEDLNAASPAAYGNGQMNLSTISEASYRYTNPYGEVEFPMLSIPLCTPQVQSAFIPRPTLAPLVFPLGSINAPANQNSPSHVEPAAQNEQYSLPHFWGRYPPNGHLQHVDEEAREISSVVEVRGVAPTENLSCTGNNDDDEDDFDNPIPDPYFQLAENNSLHTVKSKADSYTGSLFCESLRSLISHNTDNENIFPSFSCSSVQGCCPSIVVQSRGTTLSNDSLPSIIVEENNCSKSVDEDYLATEKFMNDVNTALNESVLDQIQGRVDIHSNLLGRGDGSIPMNPGRSNQEDQMETQDNDVLLRNSLGENISINNSKLTLLDGILGADISGNSPEPKRNTSELDGESSISAQDHCRELLDSLLDNVIADMVDRSPLDEQGSEVQEANTDFRENVHEIQTNQDADLIVQSMMFIEGMPDELRGMWSKTSRREQEIHESNDEILSLDEVVDAIDVAEGNDEEPLKEPGDTILESAQDTVSEDTPNRRGRRNRRRRNKPSDVEPELGTEVTGIAIGDGVQTFQDQLSETNIDKTEDCLPISSRSEQLRNETNGGNPSKDAGGEFFANGNPQGSSKSEQVIDQIEDGEGHQGEDDDPGENSGNTPNNRRRRNRRRKRRN